MSPPRIKDLDSFLDRASVRLLFYGIVFSGSLTACASIAWRDVSEGITENSNENASLKADVDKAIKDVHDKIGEVERSIDEVKEDTVELTISTKVIEATVKRIEKAIDR